MIQWSRDLWEGFYTVLVGMKITWRHLFTPSVTLQYPEEKWTLPPRSRMRLFMKYEDCIGCGQCARACPVQCIYIKADKRDPKAPPIYAANGQGIKLDVAVFDIDMSLCCYCNLCTYPCPTDCIYMTPEYEFATTDLTQHLYHFAKKNAKFLTVNPKPPAAKPAAPAAAAGAAAAPAAPAAGTSSPTTPAPPKPATPGAAVAPRPPQSPASTPEGPTTVPPQTPAAQGGTPRNDQEPMKPNTASDDNKAS
jgi:NADH-quinone oxidoreductase subunit I